VRDLSRPGTAAGASDATCTALQLAILAQDRDWDLEKIASTFPWTFGEATTPWDSVRPPLRWQFPRGMKESVKK